MRQPPSLVVAAEVPPSHPSSHAREELGGPLPQSEQGSPTNQISFPSGSLLKTWLLPLPERPTWPVEGGTFGGTATSEIPQLLQQNQQ